MLCKELQLFGGETLGIDGSFFKADASKDRIYNEDKLHQQLQKLEQKINAYQEQLALQDEADNQAGLGSLIEDKQLNEKLTALKEQKFTPYLEASFRKGKKRLVSKSWRMDETYSSRTTLESCNATKPYSLYLNR